jgi:hypothetical protein
MSRIGDYRHNVGRFWGSLLPKTGCQARKGLEEAS